MKKKGFTLIELLAVIVILAIIALIAVPIVINVIEKTKKASFEQTLNSVLKAVDIYQIKEEMTGGITECRYFSFNSDVDEVTVRDDKTYYPLKNLNLKGKIPTEGELKICEYGITLEASDGSYAGSYDGNVINVNKGDLSSNDFATPVIDIFNVTTQLDRIIVSVLAHSPGIGGVISNYYYKINDGEYIKTTEKSYIFDKFTAEEKLTPNTEYTISIKVENKSGVIKEESKTVKTKAFGEITIDVENNGTWTTSKKVTLSGTTNEYEMEYMIEKYNPEIDENETSEFVKYENPFTLDTIATPLHPTIITARYSSNGNYSDYKSYSVTKIDPTAPTTTEPSVNVSTTKPTSEASVVIRQEDLESGLDESTIEYGYSEEANGTYKWQTNALLTKLTSGKKYYVKTKVKNNFGLETESAIKEYIPGGINTCSVTPLQSGWTTNKDVQIKGSQTGTELQYQVGATEDNSWVSIENNGTINITENTTVYCRLWDGTTAGAYGSGSVNQIDRTKPTIEINSNIPSYITKGDNYEISNYINVSYGASGGSYECSSNLNGKFLNLSSLDIGNHEITCTATGNTNLNSNTKTNLLIFNPDYISNKADDLIWTYSYDTNYREFYKTNSGWTLFSYATYMLPDSNGTIWTAPLLVSTNRDAVIYDTRVDYIETAPPSTSFTYLGQTWYVSGCGAWFSDNSISTNGNAKKVYINANFSSMEKAGQELIDIALKNTVQDSIEISQKSVNNSINSISVDISLSTLDLSKISCYYGTSNGDYTNKCLYSRPAKDMSYTLSNSLNSNTTYYYKICASSMTGQEKCIINSA